MMIKKIPTQPLSPRGGEGRGREICTVADGTSIYKTCDQFAKISSSRKNQTCIDDRLFLFSSSASPNETLSSSV